MTEVANTSKRRDYTKYVPFIGREHNLRMLLYLTHAALNEARHVQVAKNGLTRADADLLFLVGALDESATPANLSRWLQRKPPTVCEQLDRLETRGLVRRRRIEGNNKSKRIVLTKAGQASMEGAMEDDVVVSIMNSLSEKEREQLWRLLEKLREEALARTERVKAPDSPP